MPEKIREIIDSYEEIIRMHQLNEELLETLELSLIWIDDFSKKHDLIIPDRQKISCLLRKTTNLLEEIRKPNQNILIRRNFTARKTDEDLTEP